MIYHIGDYQIRNNIFLVNPADYINKCLSLITDLVRPFWSKLKGQFVRQIYFAKLCWSTSAKTNDKAFPFSYVNVLDSKLLGDKKTLINKYSC